MTRPFCLIRTRHIEDTKQNKEHNRQNRNRYATDNNQIANATLIIVGTVFGVITFADTRDCIIAVATFRWRHQDGDYHDNADDTDQSNDYPLDNRETVRDPLRTTNVRVRQ